MDNEPKYTALTPEEQRIWRMGYDKRDSELRPEPTAGDVEAARELAVAIIEKYGPAYWNDATVPKRCPEAEAALSAARGNRKALEDELKKWHEIGRRAKRNLDAPFTAENPVQILVDAAALAALVKAEEVESGETRS